VPDKDVPSCGGCGEGFALFRRRHHCRRCGNVFCGYCSNQDWVHEISGSKKQWVCLACCDPIVGVLVTTLSLRIRAPDVDRLDVATTQRNIGTLVRDRALLQRRAQDLKRARQLLRSALWWFRASLHTLRGFEGADSPAGEVVEEVVATEALLAPGALELLPSPSRAASPGAPSLGDRGRAGAEQGPLSPAGLPSLERERAHVWVRGKRRSPVCVCIAVGLG
jgi:hypothetical protein